MKTGVSPERIATGILTLSVPSSSLLLLFRFDTQTEMQPLLLLASSLRKEVIQPHLPIRLPCYDFTPVIDPAFGSSLPCRLGH